jgi:hypothetical protein
MSSRWNLPDPLPEHPSPPHDIGDLCLVTIDFHCTWPQKIRRRVQVKKLCFHVLS